MIIKKLTIKNFRSYCGEQSFVFSNHLNLILGANGDGKSTLFDAIKWVFSTDGTNSDVTASSLVSQKFYSSLPPAGFGEVRVSIFMSHSNHDYILERSFFVTKDNDGKMKISNHSHVGYMTIPGVSRKTSPAQDIIEKKGLFPAVIRKYCLFKGESELNIFKDQKTLINLINLFSEVKDFDPFKDFSHYAELLADQARKNAIDKDKKNEKKALECKQKIQEKQILLQSFIDRRNDWQKSYLDYDKWISDLENSRDTIELVHGIQDNINTKVSQKDNLEAQLDENYSIKLLDNYWILYGFKPILEEFAELTRSISEERERINDEFKTQIIKEKAEKEAEEKTLKKFAQLPWFIPDIKTMEEMLSEHRCKVCGTEAPEGSEQYNFMYKRLQEALKEKKGEGTKEADKKETPKSPFVHDYIRPLRQHSISLYGFDSQIERIGSLINEKIEENDKIHEQIDELAHKIQEGKNKINEIVAQSASGVDADSYYDLFTKLKNWSDSKEETNEKILDANKKIPELTKEIDALNREYNKYVGTEGQIYANMYSFYSLLSKSLDKAEAISFDRFLEKLKEEANKFITILNVDDFTGYVDIYDNGGGKVFLQLIDKNGKIVEHPNTSLETTMHISILLAISELTKKERDNEYPLIFDAPTSTFDEGKDSDFYKCLNTGVEKQCIVVTKSFLNRTGNNEYEIDKDRLKDFKCPIYRIKKKAGFDQKDLSTIETIVEPINNN